MLYIIILLLILIFIYIFDYRCVLKNRNTFYNLLLFVFILIAGLRYRVGIDTISYMEDYRFIPNLIELKFNYIFSSRYQPGWVLYTSILKTLSSSFVLLQFVNALFINIVIFKLIRQETNKIFTGVLLYYTLYYFEFNFEILRESIAVCIFLLSVDSIKNGNTIKMYFLFFLAFMFHASAIFLFFIPIVFKIKNTLLQFYIIITVVIFSSFLFQFIQNIFSALAFTDTLSMYEEGYFYREITEGNLNYYLGVYIPRFLIPTVIYFFYKRYKETQTIDSFVFLYIVFGSLYIVFNPFHRLNNYLGVFYIIMCSNTLYLLLQKFKNTKLLILCGMLLLILFFPVFFNFKKVELRNGAFAPYYHRYYPYSSVIYPTRVYTREESVPSSIREKIKK